MANVQDQWDTYARAYQPDWMSRIRTADNGDALQSLDSTSGTNAQTANTQTGQFQQSNDWTPEYLKAYYASRNTTPNATSIDYWMGKKSELDQRGKEIGNANYANERLAAADEFGNTGSNATTGFTQWQGLNDFSGKANSLYDLLMNRANQSLQIDPHDPIIQNQANAYNAMQQRASRNYLADVAEKQGANANISAERRSAAERVGQASSAFEAQLMGRELDARRQEIQNALNGAMGFLSDQQRMALQKELTQLGLAQRAYEYDSNMQYQMSPLGSNY